MSHLIFFKHVKLRNGLTLALTLSSFIQSFTVSKLIIAKKVLIRGEILSLAQAEPKPSPNQP